KTPLFPFHGWLPDTYCNAPVPVTILLSAILSKAGIYGLIRISLGIFPTQMVAWSPIILTLATIGVLYGAFCAWGQRDYKRLIAYSSFSHVNFIIAGLFVWNDMAHSGAILQSVNHAITITSLFLVAGWLETRLGTTYMGNVSGLTAYMPKLSWLTLFFVLSAVALPGLNSFISELMLLYGVFQYNMWLSGILGLTIILSVIYMLKWIHRMYFNEPSPYQPTYRDIKPSQMLLAAPLVALILWLGIYPGPALQIIIHTTMSQT
ncbi:MAG: NADH-quinone oxidoreductase subunit M, partial [Chlamydiales bacterium]|nr:NADH-quinone oxidoreductase subunit M [Chlamydiales bacterium]